VSKIGIPRTLAYFIYFPLWKTFFEELGHEVVLSPATSKAILDRGVKEAVNDACIPIKLYHGHAAALAAKADYIFCPRLVSVRSHGDFGTETFCPKFLGLPDMLRLAMDDLPEIIDVRVDLKQGKDELGQLSQEIGKSLGNSREEIKRALNRARERQRQYYRLLYQGMLPPEALKIIEKKNPVPRKVKSNENYDLKVAVVGYPYLLYDAYINAGLLAILEKEKVKVYTQDMISDRKMNRQAKTLPKSTFWYFSNRVIYGALHFMQRPEIEGVIHLTAFACGPDSMVDRLLEIESRRRGNRPYLSIAVDEHTGEAGVRTRIEAFVDMLRYRRERK